MSMHCLCRDRLAHAVSTAVAQLRLLRSTDEPNASVDRLLRPKLRFGSVRFRSVRFGELRDSAEDSAEYSVLFGVEMSALCLLLFMSYNSNLF